jgi:hypothetical protein
LRIPRDWWASLVLVIALVGLAELTARFLLAPIGDYLWAYESTAQSRSFEWYRVQARNGNPPDVVVIGDSTGSRNLDPASFGAAAGVEEVVNLARPGNFPRAMLSNTLPLLDQENVPDFVVLMQWPESLRDDPRTDQIEAGAVSPVLEAKLEGRLIPTDITYLARLFPARQYLVDHWIRRRPLLRPARNDGFFPLDPEETPVVRANPQLPDGVEPSYSSSRRQVIVELLDLARERGFAVIIPAGPYRTGSSYAYGNYHYDWLLEQQAAYCGILFLLDYRNLTDIPYEKFKDNHHLYETGAIEWSARFGEDVRTLIDQGAELRNRCD